MCGEKTGKEAAFLSKLGSPPRVRGKGHPMHPGPAYTGITPACAGKRHYSELSTFLLRDHPRVCGEKESTSADPVAEEGSPPRVRGKVVVKNMKNTAYRITPACAGKRRLSSACTWLSWDHPRVCGEKQGANSMAYNAGGSPPRVRGKARVETAGKPAPGITPACAGQRLKRSHSIGHFSCILCLFHSVLHRASVSGGSRAGPCAPPCLPAQNAVPV